jgi:hypothetical protein
MPTLFSKFLCRYSVRIVTPNLHRPLCIEAHLHA